MLSLSLAVLMFHLLDLALIRCFGLFYLEFMALLHCLHLAIEMVNHALKLIYSLLQCRYLCIEISLAMFPTNLLSHMSFYGILKLRFRLLSSELFFEVNTLKFIYIFIVFLLQISNYKFMLTLSLMLLSTKTMQCIFLCHLGFFDKFLLLLKVGFLLLVNLMLKFSHFLQVIFLKVSENSSDFTTTAILNLFLDRNNGLFLFFSSCVHHSHPTFIVFLYLIFEFLDSFSVTLLLFLQLYVNSSLLLSMVFFKFVEFEGAIIELYL
jgi:hypothetical protein